MSKKCGKCKEQKPLTEFYKDRTRTDGYNHKCRDCQNAYWNEAQYPKLKKTEKYQAKHRISVSNYARNNPLKAKAHRLAKAVDIAENCENCGNQSTLHKHHPDYTKPFNVIALCIPCHEAVHHRGLLV